MVLTAPTLVGRSVQLESLSDEHAEALFRHADAQTFRFMNVWRGTEDCEEFRSVIQRVIDRADRSFAIVMADSGEAVGSSSYLDGRTLDGSVEIGASWIAEAHRGSAVNPEAKWLLLDHAFSALGCVRVQLKTDARNTRSQRAIAKLGAVREGVLRRHLVCRDGFVRDTVVYSILKSEWPDVQARLEERLGYRPGQ